MPHTTTWEPDGILWEFSGTVSMQEINAANAEFYRDARSDTARYQIFDASRVTRFIGTDVEVKTIAATDQGASITIRNLKVALVLRDEFKPLGQAYVDYSVKLNSTWKFGLFDTVEAARAWVDAGD